MKTYENEVLSVEQIEEPIFIFEQGRAHLHITNFSPDQYGLYLKTARCFALLQPHDSVLLGKATHHASSSDHGLYYYSASGSNDLSFFWKLFRLIKEMPNV